MPQNFIAVDREQMFLMPPSLRDWVAEDHLVWTVLGAVEEMDLAAFTMLIAWMGMVVRRMSRR